MTREEAIIILQEEADYLYGLDTPPIREAFDIAIEALKQRKTGKWIQRRHPNWDIDVLYCSECGKLNGNEYSHYCPDCGCKMEVEE